jgi:hypothetical protein
VESEICTSHVEKQNHTLRMHCRRLTRLTNAFSKKLENFKAAVALNFAYYNFVKIHGSIRCTPAMAANDSPIHCLKAFKEKEPNAILLSALELDEDTFNSAREDM